MAKRIFLPESEPAATLLTVEELVMGFSDGHVEAFRETVIAAIRETSDLLRTEEMPARFWVLVLAGGVHRPAVG